MLKNIKDSLEISYKQGLESDDNIYIKGQIKDWKEMLSNIKHEQELKDNALKMYDEGQKEIERLNNIINELEEFKEEHKIMKQILIENNLWGTLLNDDRFLEYLRK